MMNKNNMANSPQLKIIELMEKMDYFPIEYGNGTIEHFYCPNNVQTISPQLAEKIFNEVKKAELRGEIRGLEDSLSYGNDGVALELETIGTVIKDMNRLKRQLKVSEQEGE